MAQTCGSCGQRARLRNGHSPSYRNRTQLSGDVKLRKTAEGLAREHRTRCRAVFRLRDKLALHHIELLTGRPAGHRARFDLDPVPVQA